jgi:hypothetical protein
MRDYAFTILGLHDVVRRVFSYNERAIRAYRRARFKERGRRREAHRVGGRAFDEVWMDCLATDFGNSTLRTLLPQPSRDRRHNRDFPTISRPRTGQACRSITPVLPSTVTT